MVQTSQLKKSGEKGFRKIDGWGFLFISTSIFRFCLFLNASWQFQVIEFALGQSSGENNSVKLLKEEMR